MGAPLRRLAEGHSGELPNPLRLLPREWASVPGSLERRQGFLPIQARWNPYVVRGCGSVATRSRF